MQGNLHDEMLQAARQLVSLLKQNLKFLPHRHRQYKTRSNYAYSHYVTYRV